MMNQQNPMMSQQNPMMPQQQPMMSQGGNQQMMGGNQGNQMMNQRGQMPPPAAPFRRTPSGMKFLPDVSCFTGKWVVVGVVLSV